MIIATNNTPGFGRSIPRKHIWEFFLLGTRLKPCKGGDKEEEEKLMRKGTPPTWIEKREEEERMMKEEGVWSS
jgi:hypothetical protein